MENHVSAEAFSYAVCIDCTLFISWLPHTSILCIFLDFLGFQCFADSLHRAHWKCSEPCEHNQPDSHSLYCMLISWKIQPQCTQLWKVWPKSYLKPPSWAFAQQDSALYVVLYFGLSHLCLKVVAIEISTMPTPLCRTGLWKTACLILPTVFLYLKD